LFALHVRRGNHRDRSNLRHIYTLLLPRNFTEEEFKIKKKKSRKYTGDGTARDMRLPAGRVSGSY
jgi:hypothetical protein